MYGRLSLHRGIHNFVEALSMSNVLAYIGTAGIFLLSTCAAVADQTELQQIHGAFISAKFTGGCSTLVQMAEFQKSTKMPGGDEFLERFLGMESARLGMTTAQYVKACADAARVYEFYYEQTSDANGQK
ncbi:hypothetical protein AB4Z35_08490 [Pseudomonas sp. KB_15]|uniref:hypothetical protein n=1 Tax=Pseudomonas sp. KB_15 TaxID=3233035 RepID=UPI003F9456BA